VKFRIVATVSLVSCAVLVLGACEKKASKSAQDADTRPLYDTTVVQAPNATGNYLSARSAFATRDFAKALEYTTASLSQFPTNSTLLQQAFFLNIIAERWQAADTIAQRIISMNSDDYFANLVLLTSSIANKDYATAEKQLSSLPQGGLQQVWLSLYQAWISLGQGSGQQASYVLQAVDQVPELRPLVLLHNGLINQVAGNMPNALNYFAQARQAIDVLPLRFVVLYGNLLNAQKQTANLDVMLKSAEQDSDTISVSQKILQRLQTHNTEGLGLVTNAKEGFAQALYDIGTFLNSDQSRDAALIHAALSLRLMPHNDFPKLLLGRLLEETHFHDKALNYLESIPASSVFSSVAYIRRAQVLAVTKKEEAAIVVLQKALEKNPESVEIKEQLADLLRSQEKFAEAVPLYTDILARYADKKDALWTIYYARGTCYERLNEWDKAEKDLKEALALEPDQPFVLNYLGYSWVDKGINLEQALSMLHKAVDAEPENGYIVDSLGWAYYKTAKYSEAVKYLEQAVALKASDPLINDHLGDAYLKAGRVNEARFQWKRALSFAPEEQDKKRIEAKLVQ
jgi:tetratricopeptide (TPR) repeat protein